MNRLIYLVGVPVIAYGLAKGGLYFYTKQKVDEAIGAVADKVVITYGGLDAGLDGQFYLDQILIKPVGEQENIELAQLAVKGPDVLTMLLQQVPVLGDPGKIPDHLRVKAVGMKLDLTQALNVPGKQDLGAACARMTDFSADMLRSMNIKELKADAEFFWHFDEKAQELEMGAEFNLPDMQKMTLNADLANVSPQSLKGAMQIPNIREAELSLTVEPLFGDKLANYCAAKMSMNPFEYKEHLASSLINEAAAGGMRLGVGLKSAIKAFYRDWGSISLVVSPPQPLHPMALMATPPDKMADTLGLRLTVNDKMITDLSFALQQSDSSMMPQRGKAAPEPVVPTVTYRQVWKPIAPAGLPGYIDKQVKLKMRNGTDQTGYLVSATSGMLELQQRLSGGTFNINLQMAEIQSAQIQVTEKVESVKKPDDDKAAAGK